MSSRGRPLFYASNIASPDLQRFVLRTAEQPAIFTVAFDAEAGGDQERRLALPYLAGMDEIALHTAEIAFRVGDRTMAVTPKSLTAGPGGAGIVLTLPAAARLRKVELVYNPDSPPSPVPPPAPPRRLVVRPMLKDGPGPPIFAFPDFPPPGGAPGSMFGRVLTGLGRTDLGGSRYLFTFPDLLGSSWLLQVATGAAVTELTPLAEPVSVNRVEIAAAPRNLSLTLVGAPATPPTPLWSNADILLPDSGEQVVSFLPIAQRRLSEALKETAPTALALPLMLHFHSDSGATLEVTRRVLAGEYRVRPLPQDSVTLRLAGRPVPLVLRAPAQLRPTRGQTTLTARLLGRALNGGSQPAPLKGDGRGLRATADRSVAARLPIVQRGGAAAAAAAVPLASVAMRLDISAGAEVVLELRGDVAGRPGPLLAPPVVRQSEAGAADWTEFELAAPLEVAPGAAIWAAIRMTKGTVLWHADAGPPAAGGIGAACVSADRGTSWGDASDVLGFPAQLLIQAFHVEDPPQRPAIHLHDGTVPLAADWIAGAVADSATQYRIADAPLPAQILARLAATPLEPEQPRADTVILLYSASVLDLVLTGMQLGYDPLA
jgi:hypothetical protein